MSDTHEFILKVSERDRVALMCDAESFAFTSDMIVRSRRVCHCTIHINDWNSISLKLSFEYLVCSSSRLFTDHPCQECDLPNMAFRLPELLITTGSHSMHSSTVEMEKKEERTILATWTGDTGMTVSRLYL